MKGKYFSVRSNAGKENKNVRMVSGSIRASEVEPPHNKRINFMTTLPSIFTTFMLFGLGLLLFRVENPTHLMRLMDNLGGIYLNWVLIGKFLFYISPILVLDSLQVWKNDLEYFSSSKIHPVFAYGILTLFAIQFCLFSVFESKEFFYFQF